MQRQERYETVKWNEGAATKQPFRENMDQVVTHS